MTLYIIMIYIMNVDRKKKKFSQKMKHKDSNRAFSLSLLILIHYIRIVKLKATASTTARIIIVV